MHDGSVGDFVELLHLFTLDVDAARGAEYIQVTHSGANAAYGNRMIRPRDGWMEN